MPVSRQQRVDEQAAAHADAAVDRPDRQLDADACERLAPGEDVLVDAVDQRAVEVEQEGRVLAGRSRLTRRAASATRSAMSRACEPSGSSVVSSSPIRMSRPRAMAASSAGKAPVWPPWWSWGALTPPSSSAAPISPATSMSLVLDEHAHGRDAGRDQRLGVGERPHPHLDPHSAAGDQRAQLGEAGLAGVSGDVVRQLLPCGDVGVPALGVAGRRPEAGRQAQRRAGQAARIAANRRGHGVGLDRVLLVRSARVGVQLDRSAATAPRAASASSCGVIGTAGWSARGRFPLQAGLQQGHGSIRSCTST